MPPAVSLAASHELLPALRLLFPEVVELPRAGIDAAAIFVVHDQRGQVGAAALVQALPGALGLFQSSGAESAEAADALAQAACDWLRGRGVKVCQAFTTSDDEGARMAALERCGFQRVTELVSLRSAIGGDEPASGLIVTAEEPPFSDAFRATFLATDADTLDCPELTGDRTPDELLASFAAPAPGARWRLARRGDELVGVVMLAAGAEEAEWELAYLGVVPPARRRGVGNELVAFALAEALRAGASSVTVSVDSRNKPALQLYRGRGFLETGRRVVWLVHFSRSPALPAHDLPV